jgi:WhiB family redox-sensing transcriptional regulator
MGFLSNRSSGDCPPIRSFHRDRHAGVIHRGEKMTSVLDPRVRVHYAGQQVAAVVAIPAQDAPARSNWQQDAACCGTDGSFFFPPERERESARTKRIAKAKAVCLQCPVVADCRAYAMQVGEPFGVWGGLSEEERGQPLDDGRKVAELDARSKPPARPRTSAISGVRQRSARAS